MNEPRRRHRASRLPALRAAALAVAAAGVAGGVAAASSVALAEQVAGARQAPVVAAPATAAAGTPLHEARAFVALTGVRAYGRPALGSSPVANASAAVSTKAAKAQAASARAAKAQAASARVAKTQTAVLAGHMRLAQKAPTLAGRVSASKSVARTLASRQGWGSRQFACLEALWKKESDWVVSADNPTSSAYGIPQALPGPRMSSHGRDWKTNPVTQIRWGLDYIDDRYGTPCAAWSHSRATNWY